MAFHAIGEFNRSDVVARWVDQPVPRIDIEKQIEQAWRQAQSRPGIKLFDGPMCRLERFHAREKLELELTRTSYKIFWGTNLTNPALGDKYGPDILANPIGLSCALESSDGYLMLGRRSASVAYYPLRIHPFAGSLEPAERVDVFADVERELAEELAFSPPDIARVVCIGMVEDVSIRQPELVFHVRSTRPRSRIEQMLDAAEHEACVAIEPSPQALEAALKNPALTPVALGTALLWGRGRFGAPWFDAANRAVNLGGHESQ
ncbi:MAG TPA: hypothetical protein VHX86_18695 [Tepidisphaeraceae bacterium]|nr:hypothetical protein [Tepidisphaeraceae bacterium]